MTRLQDILGKLTIIDDDSSRTRPGSGWAGGRHGVHAETVALLRVGASVAIGSSAICRAWSAGLAVAAGATDVEIVEVLLAIAPIAGLGRVSPRPRHCGRTRLAPAEWATVEPGPVAWISLDDHHPHHPQHREDACGGDPSEVRRLVARSGDRPDARAGLFPRDVGEA